MFKIGNLASEEASRKEFVIMERCARCDKETIDGEEFCSEHCEELAREDAMVEHSEFMEIE